MELQNIIINQLLKMDIFYVKVSSSHLNEEFILLHTLMSRVNMLLNLAMKEIITVLFQNRVNPNNLVRLTKQETGVGEYWISPNSTDLRPYGICIKKMR